MKIYSLFILAVTAPLLSYGAPPSSEPSSSSAATSPAKSSAPAKIKGLVVPNRQSVSLTYEPKINVSVPLNKVLVSQGDKVKKDDKVFDFDLRGLDQELVDIQLQVEAKDLEVEKLKVEADKEQIAGERRVQSAERAVLRGSEDIQDFAEKRKAAMLRDEELKLARAKENLATRQEELQQLKLIYGDDNISEASEKIVHTRIVNDIREAETVLKNAQVSYDLATKKGIVRIDEDQKTALENAQLQLEDVMKQSVFALKEKQAALALAKLSLTRLLEKQALIKEAYALLPSKAPVSGIVLFGAYRGDFWVSTPTPKLLAGGKIESNDRLATIVPDDATWVVQASVPEGMESPKEGTLMTISFQSEEYPAKVTKSNLIPNNEGVRFLELTPIKSDGLLPCFPVLISVVEEDVASPSANAQVPPWLREDVVEEDVASPSANAQVPPWLREDSVERKKPVAKSKL